MARGLMPGWQRAPGWSESNKIYLSPGEDVEREPLTTIPEEERHIYEVKFNKTINLFISPGDVIEITRILKDNSYKETRAIPFIDREDGGLDEWIKEITKDLCEANWDRTNFEVGGGFLKPSDGAIAEGLSACEIEITYKKYTPPKIRIRIPQDVLDRIERLEELIADSMKAIEEYEDMIADILAKKEEERTVEDKEKLLRIDGYIRSEKENIRKFEFEIKRLKTEWNIE